MYEKNDVLTCETEETSAVDRYLEKKAKKRKKVIISLIALAIAVVCLVFFVYKTSDFKVNSIKFGRSPGLHKILCRAELIGESDDGNTLFYSYKTFENGILNDISVHFTFEENKLSKVSVFPSGKMSDELKEQIIKHYDMKNVSFTGTELYSEYKGYHVYLDSYSDLTHITITEEPTHDLTVEYPDIEDVKVDSRTRTLLDEIELFKITDIHSTKILSPDGSTFTPLDVQMFRLTFDKFVDYFSKLCEAYQKYPENIEIMDSLISMIEARKELSETGRKISDSLSGEDRVEYAKWMVEKLKILSTAYKSLPGNDR